MGHREWRQPRIPPGWMLAVFSAGNLEPTGRVAAGIEAEARTWADRVDYQGRDKLPVPRGRLVEVPNPRGLKSGWRFQGESSEDQAQWLGYTQSIAARAIPAVIPEDQREIAAPLGPPHMAFRGQDDPARWAKAVLADEVGPVRLKTDKYDGGRMVRVEVRRAADDHPIANAFADVDPESGNAEAVHQATVDATNNALICLAGDHRFCEGQRPPPRLPWPPLADRKGQYTDATWRRALKDALALPEVLALMDQVRLFNRWILAEHGERAHEGFIRAWPVNSPPKVRADVLDQTLMLAKTPLGEPEKDKRTPATLQAWRDGRLAKFVEHCKGALDALHADVVWQGGADAAAAALRGTPAESAIKPLAEWYYQLDRLGHGTLRGVEAGKVNLDERQKAKDVAKAEDEARREQRWVDFGAAIAKIGSELIALRTAQIRKPTLPLLEEAVHLAFPNQADVVKEPVWGGPKPRTQYAVQFRDDTPKIESMRILGPPLRGARNALAGLIVCLEYAAGKPDPRNAFYAMSRGIEKGSADHDILRPEPAGQPAPAPEAPGPEPAAAATGPSSAAALPAPPVPALAPGTYRVDNPHGIPLTIRVHPPAPGELDCLVDFAVAGSQSGPHQAWLSHFRLAALAAHVAAVPHAAYSSAAKRVMEPPHVGDKAEWMGEPNAVLSVVAGRLNWDLVTDITVWKFWLQSPDGSRRWVYEHQVARWLKGDAKKPPSAFPVLEALGAADSYDAAQLLVGRITREAGDYKEPGRAALQPRERAAELLFVAAGLEIAEATWLPIRAPQGSEGRSLAGRWVREPEALVDWVLMQGPDWSMTRTLRAMSYRLDAPRIDALVRSWTVEP